MTIINIMTYCVLLKNTFLQSRNGSMFNPYTILAYFSVLNSFFTFVCIFFYDILCNKLAHESVFVLVFNSNVVFLHLTY